MALSMICYIFLQLFLLVNANKDLTINPQNPVVPLGGSIKLNCSINNHCTTIWKGLDLNLGSVYSAPGYSVMTIENASFLVDGNKICVNSCPGRRSLESTVNLQVYALPETLRLSTNITDGVPYLHCEMNGVRPIEFIRIQCYRGFEKLDNYSEEIIQDLDLDIYNVSWSWKLTNDDLNAHTSYNCEAELSVGEQTFKRVGKLEIPEEVGTTVTFARTVTNGESQNTAISTETPKKISTTSTIITTDATTFYTRSSQRRTTSSSSTLFSSLTTHKQLPTSNTVPIANTPAKIVTTTGDQNTVSTSSTSMSKDTTTEMTSLSPSPSIITHKEFHAVDIVSTADPLAVSVINTENHSTDMTTRTDMPTTQRTLSTLAASTEFSSFPTHKGVPPSETNFIDIIWMALPAVGLAGSILISLQIWRQLNKTGFFQPNKSHWSDCKHGAKDLLYDLETGSPHYVSVR